MTPELEKAIREARAELGEGHIACQTGGIDNAVTAALRTLADPSDERVEAKAEVLYSESWVATDTGPNAPRWSEITATPAGDRYRRMARASIASDVKFLLEEG